MTKGNPYTVFNLVKRMNNGESEESITKEIETVGKKIAKEKGKCWGECEACGDTTVLVVPNMLCGPCCFGEAETYNGNF